jgi:hypothetical protein
VRVRIWVAVVIAAIPVAITAWCGFQVYRAIDRLRYPGGHCSTADDRFTRQLADNVMVKKAPDGMATVYTKRFQPCEGNGDSSSSYYGGVTVDWAYPAVPPPTGAVQDFYRTLGAANGWTVTAGPDLESLNGCKVIDGTAVLFLLRVGGVVDDRAGYLVELSYSHLHDRFRCG